MRSASGSPSASMPRCGWTTTSTSSRSASGGRVSPQGHDNVVVVKIGTGIGAGIISDGRLHRGAQGSAGDVGHIQVVDDPSVVCRCGNVGCLEALAGGHALRIQGEAAAARGLSARMAAALDERGTVTAEDVARAAAFGDPVAIGMLQEAGQRVGQMLASVVNFFNPSLIVIGGGVAQSGDQLLAAIRQTVYGRSLPLATRSLVIQRSSLGMLGGRHRHLGAGRRPAVLARCDRGLARGRRPRRHARGRPRLTGRAGCGTLRGARRQPRPRTPSAPGGAAGTTPDSPAPPAHGARVAGSRAFRSPVTRSQASRASSSRARPTVIPAVGTALAP